MTAPAPPAPPAQPAPPGSQRAHRLVGGAVLVTLLITGLALGLRHGVRDDVLIRNFGVVEEGQIYRAGRQTPAATARIVRDHGIRTIIDLGAYEADSPQERRLANTALALGVTRHRFPLHGDGTGDPNAYVHALRVLADERNFPVLVQCAAGSQRTSGCIMLYREAVQGVPMEQSHHEALAHAHDPDDNPHLWPYLTHYRASILAAFNAARNGVAPPPIPYIEQGPGFARPGLPTRPPSPAPEPAAPAP